MDGFSYRAGELHCELAPLTEVAQEHGTPAFVYSATALTNRVNRLSAIWKDCGLDIDLHFAVKACSNTHVLRALGALGCGADVVSGGELFRATLAQIAPEKIVFSGVGKSHGELSQAAKAEIYSFNAETLGELDDLQTIAKEIGTRPRVALRVNPNVAGKTHPYISTGARNNKFGFSEDELKALLSRIKTWPDLDFHGLSCHIGSQITDLAPLKKSWRAIAALAAKVPFRVDYLGLGGGLGVDYDAKAAAPSLEDFARAVVEVFADETRFKKAKFGVELGRAITGPTGILLTRVVRVKRRKNNCIVVVDAGMNDLLRPALYGAKHPVLEIRAPKTGAAKTNCILVGPVCESSDVFLEKIALHAPKEGDLICIGVAGAYGSTMSSNYNARPHAAEVLVRENSAHLIRRRESLTDLVEQEIF